MVKEGLSADVTLKQSHKGGEGRAMWGPERREFQAEETASAKVLGVEPWLVSLRNNEEADGVEQSE